jgi:tRNA threonylcarbamoyladenosine biosynthesis protein TsaE
MLLEIISNSPEKTQEIGNRIGQLLEGGEVIALLGDLGAGKTTFTKGLARGLAIEETLTSPTFTLIREYQGRLPLYHMDAYRLGSSQEAELCGLAEYFDQQGIVVVEWPQNIWELIPDTALRVTISFTSQGRSLTFRGSEGWSRIGELIYDPCP